MGNHEISGELLQVRAQMSKALCIPKKFSTMLLC